MLEYAEKRDFIRMTVACDMEIHHSDQRQSEMVKLEDLSATGMRFFADQALEAGQKLDVTIHPGSDITPPMQAQIAVIRCDAADNRFDIAASIENVAPAVYTEEAQSA